MFGYVEATCYRDPLSSVMPGIAGTAGILYV